MMHILQAGILIAVFWVILSAFGYFRDVPYPTKFYRFLVGSLALVVLLYIVGVL